MGYSPSKNKFVVVHSTNRNADGLQSKRNVSGDCKQQLAYNVVHEVMWAGRTSVNSLQQHV